MTIMRKTIPIRNSRIIFKYNLDCETNELPVKLPVKVSICDLTHTEFTLVVIRPRTHPHETLRLSQKYSRRAVSCFKND